MWRLERRERAGVLGFKSELALARGAQRAPALAPVMQLDAALGTAVGPETVGLVKAVKRLRKVRSDIGRSLLDAARDDLAARGLATVRRDRVLGLFPRTRLDPTPAGEALRSESVQREDALRAALGWVEDPHGSARELAAAGVLVLFADPAALRELDEHLRERRGTADGGYGGSPGDGWDFDFSDVSSFDAFDPGIDTAVDSGGGGGGGGDGGGDGGGGGGGGD